MTTRISIIGNSGSGKSTLARRLAAESSFPIFDLDIVAWEPDQIAVARPAEQARSDVREFCRMHESWVVEGCYANIIDATLSFKPTLIVLDLGVDQCSSNCRARPWEPHKYPSKAEQDSHLAFLLGWIEEYYTRDDDMSLAAHKELYRCYDGPKHWLSGLPSESFTLSGLPNET